MSAILLIVVPLITAFISILFKKISPYLLLIVSFLSVISLGYLEAGTITIGGFEAPYGINLVLDLYSLYALYIVNTLFFLVVALNGAKFHKISTVLLIALAGLNGLLLTGDLFNLFVFIEVSGIAAYLITTTNKKPLATFNYLVQGTIGSSLYLLGLIILYAMFGTLNIADMANEISQLSIFDKGLTAFPFLLMFIGLGVEAKLLPLNSWAKGILASSNKLTGPMIASVYASAIGFVFGRLITELFVISSTFSDIVTIILVVSIVAGEAMAFSSKKVREILLFSSIAQAAIVVLVFIHGFVGWAVFLIIANGASKLILFTVANHASDELGTDDVKSLKGLFVNNKIVGVAFSVASLSTIGLPLFLGFVVKVSILDQFFIAGNLFFPAVILITSVVEGIYFVRLLLELWYKDSDLPKVNYDFTLKYVVVIIAVLLIVFGIFSDPIEVEVDNINEVHFIEGGNL